MPGRNFLGRAGADDRPRVHPRSQLKKEPLLDVTVVASDDLAADLWFGWCCDFGESRPVAIEPAGVEDRPA